MTEAPLVSLFSGIGGLELGLERAGVGRTVLQVERDPYCRAVLERHWPGVRRMDDVRLVTGRDVPAGAILCGGFPCQDVSSAGRRVGLSGERSGLWREFSRIIGEAGPEVVVIENVASGWRRWLPFVRRDLWAWGYASVPVVIGAYQVGGRHRRDRVFVVASRDGDVVTRVGRAAADPDCARLAGLRGERGDARQATAATAERNAGAPHVVAWDGLEAEPALVRGVHGIPAWLDGAARAAGWTPAQVSAARIRALGNSVVPACAEVIGRLIVGALDDSRRAA